MPAEYSLRMSAPHQPHAPTAARAAQPSPSSGLAASASPRPRLILASRSPRRRSLLDEHGFTHEAVHPGFEDSSLSRGNVSPEQWVTSLAYLKAWARAFDAAARTFPTLILGADTACLMDNRLIGTPTDAREAEQIIRSFLNRTHDVLTGVAIIDLRTQTPTRHLFLDRARVTFGNLSDKQISDYISSNAWQGKAGAYNYREALALNWPLTHQGDPTTIMGLPMQALTRHLAALGVSPITTSASRGSPLPRLNLTPYRGAVA